jgi:hypothetical protein
VALLRRRDQLHARRGLLDEARLAGLEILDWTGRRICLARTKQNRLRVRLEMRERVNITIDPDLLRRVRELAEREHRAFSAQVAVLLAQALDASPAPGRAAVTREGASK